MPGGHGLQTVPLLLGDLEIPSRLGRLRVDGQRPLKGVNRFVQLLLDRERSAQTVERLDGIRHQAHSRAQLRDGVVELFGLKEETAQIEVDLTVVGIELHGSAKVRDRLLAGNQAERQGDEGTNEDWQE